MNIEGFVIKKYARGWSLNCPYIGTDKQGNEKTQYRQTYYPRLSQCLLNVREALAKDCESVEELIALLRSAESIDRAVIAQSGLVDVFTARGKEAALEKAQ